MMCIQQTPEISQVHFGVLPFTSSYDIHKKNYETLKNSKVDMGIFVVCYIHSMLIHGVDIKGNDVCCYLLLL